MKADLVDADRLRPIIRPEIGVDFKTARLPFTEQQLLRERACKCGLANALLAGQAVCVSQAAGTLVCSEDGEGPLMPGDRRKTSRNGWGRPRGSTNTRRWHAAHLNKSFLDAGRKSFLCCRRFRQRSCQLVGIVRSPVAAHVIAPLRMDAEETHKQNKIRELQAVVA